MSLSSPRLSISQDSSSTTGTAPEIQSPSTLSSSSATNITGPDTINATETSAIPNIRTPYASSPGSAGGSSTGLSYQHGLRYPDHYFRSRRVQKGDIAKPWLEKKDLREKWVTIIPCVGLLFGLAICGLLVYLGLKSVVNHKYCPVMMEDWSNGFDESIWTREVEVGGYG